MKVENAPLRLWVLSECYPKPFALNHCAFVHRQTVGIKEAGWQIEVLIPSGWYPPLLWPIAPAWRSAHARSIPAGWKLDEIPIKSLLYQNRVPARFCRPRDTLLRITVALKSYLHKRISPDSSHLLLVHFALPYGPVARTVADSLRIPYVVYLRGDDVWRYPSMDGGKRMKNFVSTMENAPLVLAVSRSLIEEAQRMMGKIIQRAAVVPNGIDLELFRPAQSIDERMNLRKQLGLRDEELVIVCVADALIRKGWNELLDALGGMTISGASPVLVAVQRSSKKQIDIAQEAARRAPQVRLVLLSDLTSERLAGAYRCSDVFCLLSHWEGMSNSLLEAMASGLPVIASNAGGHAEALTDGVEGFIVPIQSPDAACSALTKLAQSEELRERFGKAARLRAEAIGDSKKAGRRLSAVLKNLLSGQIDEFPLTDNPYSLHVV